MSDNPETPQGDPAPETPQDGDQPLGEGGLKALQAEREAREKADKQVKTLQGKIDDLNKQLATVKNDGLPEWQQKFNDLQAKLDNEIQARQKAEQASAAAERTQYGLDKGLPMPLAKRLTGATPEELDAEVAELLPLVGPHSPLPNPQQGNPSQARGGTLSAGRERFAAQSK